MKYYLIAGEASGDLHGCNLMKALKERDAQAEFRFFGGDLMLAEDGTLVKHFADMAYMGFIEVVANLPAILKNLAFCKQAAGCFDFD
jgi:lipid-A-disaccharide synthase